MRPKLRLLTAIVLIVFASSAYILKNNNDRETCSGKCATRPTPKDSSTGGGDMYEGSFNHFIVSTIR
jgi:hypothetical protein